MPKKKWRKKILFAAIIVIIAVGFLGIYFSKNQTANSMHQKFTSWIMDLRSHLSHKKTNTSQATQDSSFQQVKQEPEIRFNFYTELPNMQVTLPEGDKTASTPLPNAKTDKNNTKETPQYFLQLGVFKNESAAGQLRVSLLLAGCEADIVTSTEKDASILYHVQKGPFATLSQAKEAQKKLQNKGIAGTIKQL